MSQTTAEGAIETAYGRLDFKVLEKLRDGYETTTLLKTIDELDDLVREACGEDGLRDMLLRLHSMAHTIINGAALNGAAEADTLPDLAQELTMQMSAAISMLQSWVRRIEPLEELAARD